MIALVPAVLVAHHVALLAIPAVAPAVIVAVVIFVIMWRDRRDERREREDDHT
ncbi:MAG TPA: hypothetical protein VK948_02355 [Aeromicrobium sp.]|nr:hypothetical protein [Aeromicrobium sp.]